MGTPDFSTILILGALVGLLFVAIGYGQLVWLQRQAKGPSGAAVSGASILFWLILIASGVCLARAVTSRTFPEQEATLTGEDLFAVQPRVGLNATYETRANLVRKDDVLIRFTGRDGEEGQVAIKSRKAILEGELEIERARPLEFDPEMVRRVDQAKSQLREREQRQKQVLSERDSIAREATQQRLAVDNRRYRAEQDERAAERELKPLQASLETEKAELESQESLLRQGMLSKMEVARQRDKVTDLEGRIAELEDRRALLQRELEGIKSLHEQSERTFTGQGASRSEENTKILSDIADARKLVEATTRMLEQDRPRAEAQREKRLAQIQVQIHECDELLSGQGRHAQVVAPFDGRVGFREPSPSSPPADNGPLLVMYRPGKMTASAHLDADEDDAGADLGAEIIIGAELLGRERTINAEVLQRTTAHGETELLIACDPPERVVRQVAMSGAAPVRVRLKRSVASSLAFKLSMLLGAAAFALAGYRSIRRRISGEGPLGTPQPPPQAPPHAPPSGGIDPGHFAPGGLGASPAQAQGHPTPGSTPRALPPLPAQHQLPGPLDGNAFARPVGDGLSPDERDPLYLKRLGARLRQDIEATNLSPFIVRRVHTLIGRGGFHTSAMVAVGFGEVPIDHLEVARALFDMHNRTVEAQPPLGGLGPAAQACAEFIQVMRAVGADKPTGTLDGLRSELISATLTLAQRGGASSENAGMLVKPLMEV
ncbi:MAG: hypothetical protein JST92_19640 [Deltaproteobacteria bacterium]|nr:hypothetical protein [Deltaproteobacteria bacterium]